MSIISATTHYLLPPGKWKWPPARRPILGIHKPCVGAAVLAARALVRGEGGTYYGEPTWELRERATRWLDAARDSLPNELDHWFARLNARRLNPSPIRWGETAASYHGALLDVATRILACPAYPLRDDDGEWVEVDPPDISHLDWLLAGARDEAITADEAWDERPLCWRQGGPIELRGQGKCVVVLGQECEVVSPAVYQALLALEGAYFDQRGMTQAELGESAARQVRRLRVGKYGYLWKQVISCGGRKGNGGLRLAHPDDNLLS